MLKNNKLKEKKYAFFGSPKFAEIVLDNLIKKEIKPAVVICNPDRPVGRKKIITPPPTKILALKNNIPVYQPEKLNPEEIKKKFGQIDFAIIAAYGKIIEKEIINLFKDGVFGIHPSLLPKFRGASPIQYAILNSEKYSGITIYKMNDKIDHGPILIQKKIKIIDKNYLEVEELLAKEGVIILYKILKNIINNSLILKTQDHNQATFTKKINTEDGFIELDDLKLALLGHKDMAQKIYQKILALGNEPGVYTLIKDKRIKLLDALLEEEKLILKTIQIEGKTPTNDFDKNIFNI
ncbi:MAG: methionyl-tRNA formyltransferase [Candidatus Liptonbacteria bacterium CG11_big_fil_rev_8_21_14_0_20_35_14]|uniref:methionyl-tRNA formyltransferase n=1 Tax=Candidatus Liptonbacteria bacterium CG11_big_fil_rev_8_21_14_0_20_35_14 TaxID=1974634 RepID=A0A2H0N6X8_9BACT|nr:MAG: methionyl-tRNA formyltransferase [Candidatus Liptonbacteria bacterium CG11_big_fil_rev_8_21_14_0_20_35_14]